MHAEKTDHDAPEDLDLLRPELVEAWGTRELRRDWRVNLSGDAVGGIIMLLMGLGAWGVLSGFAVFVLLHESVSKFPLAVFLSALLVAAIVGLFTEYLRERIEHGSAHDAHGSAPDAHRKRAGLLRRLPVTVLMLGLFELFISAWHGASEMGREFVVNAGLLILGDDLGSRLNAPWAVAALAVLWIIEGAFLAAVLGGALTDVSPQKRHNAGPLAARLRRALKPSAQCAMIGGFAGGFAGAAGLLVTVVLMRIVAAISLIFTEPRQWLALVQAAPEKTGITLGPIKWILFAPVQILSEIMVAHHFWGPVIALAVLVGLIKLCVDNKTYWPLWVLGIGLFVVMMAPLAGNVGTVFFMAFLAAVVWAVPGICLGASVPLLRGPAAAPRVWGFAAFIAAASLVAISYFSRNADLFPLLLGLALVVGVAGVVFWRGGDLRTYWPLAALVLAAYVGLFTAAQQATFHGVLEQLSIVLAKPGSPGTTPEPTWIDKLKDLKQFKHEEPPNQHLGLSRFYHPNFPLYTPSSQPAFLEPLGTTSAPGSEDPFQKALREQLQLGDGSSSMPSSDAIDRAFDNVLSKPPPEEPAQSRTNPEQRARETSLNFQSSDGEKLLVQTDALIHGQEHSADKDRAILEEQIKVLDDKSKDISEALKDYLSIQPERHGEPDKWPDRRAEIALQEISISIHHLKAREEDLVAVSTPRVPFPEPAELFELSITGSLAFWVTVGLLVGWASRQNEPLLIDAGEGKKKCFWARGPLADYHDHFHGKAPANDRELFERLALFCIGGQAFAKHKEVKEYVKGLDYESIAGLLPKDEYTIPGSLSLALGKGYWHRGPVLITLARKFRDLRKKLLENHQGSDRVMLDDWTARAAADPKKFVEDLRKELPLPSDMRVGTFLQSVGLVEGAHFKGCCAESADAGKAPTPPDR